MKLQARDRLRAGELWQDHGLVFASTVGTPLTANNVIRAFRGVTKKAGLGEDWVPREMRHTFVSVLSAKGVPVESIALLAGHDRTATTSRSTATRSACTHPGRRGDGQDLRLANPAGVAGCPDLLRRRSALWRPPGYNNLVGTDRRSYPGRTAARNATLATHLYSGLRVISEGK